jgi:hypothetical protein
MLKGREPQCRAKVNKIVELEKRGSCLRRTVALRRQRSHVRTVSGAPFFSLFFSAISTPGLKLQLRLIRASKQVWWKIVLATDDVGQKLASLRTVSDRICAAAFSDKLRDRPARACVSIPIDTRQIRLVSHNAMAGNRDSDLIMQTRLQNRSDRVRRADAAGRSLRTSRFHRSGWLAMLATRLSALAFLGDREGGSRLAGASRWP